MNEADARKLVNDFARAVVYGEDADILRTGAALEAALVGQKPEPSLATPAELNDSGVREGSNSTSG